MTREEWENERRVAELNGRIAMRRGLPASENPFQQGDRVEAGKGEFWRCWDNGWRDESWIR